jgi:Flp pilus assembly pilin Flp
MRNRLQELVRKIRTRAGVSLFEYALILFLVSIVAILVLQGIGGSTNNMVSSINNGFGP